jgi:hypothetical protein
MWNGRKYVAMAAAGAALALATCSPASAQYLDYGYGGIYGFGRPLAAYGSGDYSPNVAYGYGGSYRSTSYGSRETDGSNYVIKLAPVPGRPCAAARRNEPKRLE